MECDLCQSSKSVFLCGNCLKREYCSDICQHLDTFHTKQCSKIIVAAPHTCLGPRYTDPGCDKNTYTYANIIHQAIAGSQILLNETPRNVCDDNRGECRYRTQFRKDLREAYGKGGVCVVEVHSFPSGAFQNVEADVILLDTWNSPASVHLLKTLHENTNFQVALVRGSLANDIQREGREEYGNTMILLELNDRLNPEQIKNIAKFIF